MRTARARDDRNEGGAYYHLMNRAAGMRSDRPFGDVEKEKLIDSLSLFYTLEIVGYCVMSNHFHLILWAPRKKPTEAEALQRYQRVYPKARYYGEEKAAKRRLGRGADPDGGVLYSMRRPLTGT